MLKNSRLLFATVVVAIVLTGCHVLVDGPRPPGQPMPPPPSVSKAITPTPCPSPEPVEESDGDNAVEEAEERCPEDSPDKSQEE